jgi:signal transduction histidine kinase
MHQVLINLLNNAIKFTPDGGRVGLSVASESVAGFNEPCLCLAVSDTGIGIIEEDRAKLFQPFTQIDGRLNRKYQGTGLGLSIVKQIVELHGGIVTVASEVGRGSCFTVILPQACFRS